MIRVGRGIMAKTKKGFLLPIDFLQIDLLPWLGNEWTRRRGPERRAEKIVIASTPSTIDRG